MQFNVTVKVKNICVYVNSFVQCASVSGRERKTDEEEHRAVRGARLRHHPAESLPQGEATFSHLATCRRLRYVYFYIHF